MVISFNNKVINYNDKWVSPPQPIYYVYTSGTHGSVAASPTSGKSGTEVTLSNTPNTGYQFDSYSVTGATLKNTNQLDIGNSDVYVHGNFIDPYNPLGLPPFTIRLKYEGTVPSTPNYGTATLVDATQNIWDVTYNSTRWTNLLYDEDSLIEVLGANTTGVVDMARMFGDCNKLQRVALFDTSSVTDMSSLFGLCPQLISVPLFDTHNVTDIAAMFAQCSVLRTIPLFDTSNVTDAANFADYCYELRHVPLFNMPKVTRTYQMFYCCFKVESGAYDLYRHLSSLPNLITHAGTFGACGRDTVTGAAELAQIPSDWK